MIGPGTALGASSEGRAFFAGRTLLSLENVLWNPGGGGFFGGGGGGYKGSDADENNDADADGSLQPFASFLMSHLDDFETG